MTGLTQSCPESRVALEAPLRGSMNENGVCGRFRYSDLKPLAMGFDRRGVETRGVASRCRSTKQ